MEQEASEELAALSPQRRDGTLVPAEVFGVWQRDLTTGVVPAIQTTVSPNEPIPFLRVKSVCGRCGATMLDLAGGNLSLPRATGSAGAGWYGEISPVTPADPSLDNILLSPKLISGSTIVSNQLLRQGSPSIEAFVVKDISNAISVAVDQAALFGAGSATVPKGIFSYAANAPGASAYNLRAPNVTFGGASTWAEVLQFEKNLEDCRIENDGTFAFVSSPGTRTKWQQTQLAVNFPRFLWETGSNSIDGVVNGRRAVSSAQMTGDVVLLGRFSEMIIGNWLGFELVINTHSRAHQGETVIQCTALVDVQFRHVSAFCGSTDSGAQ
jgi:HK97 family phage major capsid protein